MKNFMEKFEAKIMPFAQKISTNIYLTSIRDGFLISTPLLIIGSFFMLVSNFPIASWMEFMSNTMLNGNSLADYISTVTTATFSIMAVFIVMGIGYSFAKKKETNPIFGGAISLVSWFILMPFITEFTPEGSTEVFQVASIPLDWVGSKGIFIGMIAAFLSVSVFKWAENKGWVIKMPDGIPETVGASFAALFPAAIVIILFFVIRVAFTFTPWNNAFDCVFSLLQLPLQSIGDSLGAMLLIYLFAHILWMFGIHGTNITDSIFRPILLALSAENLIALGAGETLPHIINLQFQDLFATYGGAGSTLSLVIAMLIFCHSKRIKQLGKLAIFPSFFGINEPVIFGLPIVLNPIIAIPFIVVPLFNILVSYITMAVGLVPICNGIVMPWTTPPIISGFLSSGWQGALLQLILIVIGILIYYPFIKAMDRNYLEEEKHLAK